MILHINKMSMETNNQENHFNMSPEPFNMSSMTRDLAGVQNQVRREEIMLAQRGMSVEQPHCQQQHCQILFQQQLLQQSQNEAFRDMSSIMSGLRELQLEAQPTMEAGANPQYTDYMIQRTEQEGSTETRAKAEDRQAPLFLSALAHQALQLR